MIFKKKFFVAPVNGQTAINTTWAGGPSRQGDSNFYMAFFNHLFDCLEYHWFLSRKVIAKKVIKNSVPKFDDIIIF